MTTRLSRQASVCERSATLSNLVAYSSFHLTRSVLRRFNLDIRRLGDGMGWLPSPCVDPITYQYFADLRHVPAVAVDVADIHFGIMGFPYRRGCGNPFVMAFAQAAQSPNAQGAIGSILSAFYEDARPASALEVLGLTAEEAPGLRGVSAQHWIAPWGTETVEQRARRIRMWTVKDGVANGRFVSARDGLTNFGPVSPAKLALEVERVVKLADSIATNGFRTIGKREPEVFGLRARDRYRWFVIRGQHRFAACAAFGIEQAKARVIKIVRREDVTAWPHVASGTFTRSGALKLFDRVFAGEAPSCADRWLGRCERSKDVSVS